MSLVSFADLIQHVGVNEGDLNQQCTREHLVAISKEIANWVDYAYALGLSDQDVVGIRADTLLSYGMQVQTALIMWQKRLGFKATYRCLVHVFLTERNVTVAKFICNLVKGTTDDITDERAVRPIKAATTNDVTSPHPTPLAISDLDEDTRENLEGRLLQETRDIEVIFCSYVSQLKKSLEKRNISPTILGNYLSMIKSITKELRVDSVPRLLTLVRNELCSADSIEKVFQLITPYFSFFNYDLVQHIVKEFGVERDQESFKSYLEKFDSFCRRQATEVKSVLDGEDSTTTRFRVKVEDDFMQVYTLKTVRLFRAKLCRILDVTEPCLRLVSIENGCILLTFIVPAFVLPHVFPLSKEQEEKMASEGVLAYLVGTDASQTVIIRQKEGVDLVQIGAPNSPLTPNSKPSGVRMLLPTSSPPCSPSTTPISGRRSSSRKSLPKPRMKKPAKPQSASADISTQESTTHEETSTKDETQSGVTQSGKLLQKNDDEEFGHEQQVAVVTNLWKQKDELIGIFYSSDWEARRAEQLEASLNIILSGSKNTVKRYEMDNIGGRWLKTATADGVSKYVFLGYNSMEPLSSLSWSREALHSHPLANQARRVEHAICISTTLPSLVKTYPGIWQGILQMNCGDLDNSLLAENILAHFAGCQPIPHDEDNAYWSVIPKLVRVYKDKPSLGISIMAREMSPESAFPRVTLIKTLNDDCLPGLKNRVGKYTHIQSINGYLLDGLRINDVTEVFKRESKKSHLQLVVRYIHPKVKSETTNPLAFKAGPMLKDPPITGMITPSVKAPERKKLFSLSLPSVAGSRVQRQGLWYSEGTRSPSVFSEASSGVWSMSGESVDLQFSDSEFSDKLEFSDDELSPATPADKPHEEYPSTDDMSKVLADTKTGGNVSSSPVDKSVVQVDKHKHDLPAGLFLKWAEVLSCKEDHWTTVGLKLDLLSADDTQSLRGVPSLAGIEVLRRWYKGPISHKDLVSVLTDIGLTSLAIEIENYFTGRSIAM